MQTIDTIGIGTAPQNTGTLNCMREHTRSLDDRSLFAHYIYQSLNSFFFFIRHRNKRLFFIVCLEELREQEEAVQPNH